MCLFCYFPWWSNGCYSTGLEQWLQHFCCHPYRDLPDYLETTRSQEDGELVLINFNIPEYDLAAKGQNHEPKRFRKLLLHKKEKNKIFGMIKRDGYTIIPLSCYFNKKGIVKVNLGFAKGKKQVDKRETIKKRDWERSKQRLLKVQ